MLKYANRYPANSTPVSGAYPQGSGKNSTVSGAKDGSPFEKDYINDILGFQQSMVLEAGIIPNSVADTALNSQQLTALNFTKGKIAFNYAELVAIDTDTLKTGTRVFLTDGNRGGAFVWNDGDLTTNISNDPEAGLYVPPTSDLTGASGAYVRIVGQARYNLKWWGAIGDSDTIAGGGTNNNIAILAAIAAIQFVGGGILWVPRGVYRHTVEIDVSFWYGAPAIIIEGEGDGPLNQEHVIPSIAEHTTIFLNDSNTANSFKVASVSRTIFKNISIRDFKQGTRTTGDAIFCERFGNGVISDEGAVVNLTVENVSIQGFIDGISGIRLQGTLFKHVFIEDCVRDGFHIVGKAAVGGGTSVSWEQCFVKECGRDCYFLDGHSYCTFFNCGCDLPGRHGYNVNGDIRDAVGISFYACGFESSNAAVTGTDDTSVGAVSMTDSTAAFTIDQFEGYVIHNITDDSTATIVSNDGTNVIGPLTGGTTNLWNSGDSYSIGGAGFYFGNASFGISLDTCVVSGATSDSVYSKANGLSIRSGKLQTAAGYGVNMVSGSNSLSIYETDFSGNALGRTNKNPKIMSFNIDNTNKIMLGHAVDTGGFDGDVIFQNGGGISSLDSTGTSSANYRIRSSGGDGWIYGVPVSTGDHIFAFAGVNRIQFEEQNGGPILRGLGECGADASVAANQWAIYAVDNATKTELKVKFGSGAAQSLAIEP